MTEITKTVEQTYENFMSNFGLLNPTNLPEGKTSEIEVTEDDCITRITEYTSNDGSLRTKSIICYNKDYLINKENRELREQIKNAVALEDYEWAARLKSRLRKKS